MKPQGPLKGVKILEFVGLGPAPFCGMMLSDMGADIIRIDRPGALGGGAAEILSRGRPSICLNLKEPDDASICKSLIEKSEILIEGFRPGVMERFGLGPNECFELNPALVYGRMTGWGQTGPLSQAAGHDINYIALTGALDAIGTEDKPIIPLNLVGDFGGGGMYLAFGVLAALTHARNTGEGQIVDAAIVDGVTSLMSSQHQLAAMGLWNTKRASNIFDGSAHFYAVYECLDGAHISIGPIEPHFYTLLCEHLDLDPLKYPPHWDGQNWEESRAVFKNVFKSKTRDAWCKLLEGSDVCFAPVLNYQESSEHPHMAERGVYSKLDGVVQASPAPRFSKTPGAIQGVASVPGSDRDAILKDWGLD